MSERDEASIDAPPNLVVLAGSAHPALGGAVARELGLPLGTCRTLRFPDGEIQVEIDEHEVEGEDVAIVQPTSQTTGGDSLLELLLIADACKRVGAASVFAVVPYFGYARQDSRKRAGLPLGVRVVTQMVATGPFQRLVTVDPHSDVLAGSLDMPVDAVSAVPGLVEALEGASSERERDRDVVVVAPDAGAMKLAREYGRRLRAPVAVIHKTRTSGHEVSVDHISGDVRGRRVILVDDMITTGATMVAAAQAVRDAGSADEITAAATHAVPTAGVIDRLRDARLRRLVLTDTVASSPAAEGATIVSVAPLLAASVRRISTRRRMAHFVLHP